MKTAPIGKHWYPSEIDEGKDSTGHESYCTADLCLSAFLHARGYKLATVRSTKGRATFVFLDCPALRKDVLLWANYEIVPVRLRSFVDGIRDLKGIVEVS